MGVRVAPVVVGLVAAAGCGPGAREAPVGLDGTTWTLVEMAGEPVDGGPRITLDVEAERLGGFGGCNAYGTTYALGPDGALRVGAIEQTAAACADPGHTEREVAYVARLGSATRAERNGGRLHLTTDSGDLVFEPRPVGRDAAGELAGTAWRLRTRDGRPVAAAVTLAFPGIGRAVGQAGCRAYLATWTPSDGGVAFQSVSMAGEPCPRNEEAAQGAVEALGWVRSLDLGPDGLVLHTGRGESLAFDPLPDPAEPEGPRWVLVGRLEGGVILDPVAAAPVTAAFADGEVTGRAACNGFGGSYRLEGRRLAVTDLVATQMACAGEGVMELERSFLAILGGAATAVRAGDALWIEAGDGRGLLFLAAGAGGAS